MGFIEDQNRKLAEEKQLAGKGMEYLDAKRAMDIARAQEAQRALNMRPADGGLANMYAQEIPYNPGMNEEDKYAAMIDAQIKEKAANDEMLKQATEKTEAARLLNAAKDAEMLKNYQISQSDMRAINAARGLGYNKNPVLDPTSPIGQRVDPGLAAKYIQMQEAYDSYK